MRKRKEKKRKTKHTHSYCGSKKSVVELAVDTEFVGLL